MEYISVYLEPGWTNNSQPQNNRGSDEKDIVESRMRLHEVRAPWAARVSSIVWSGNKRGQRGIKNHSGPVLNGDLKVNINVLIRNQNDSLA